MCCKLLQVCYVAQLELNGLVESLLAGIVLRSRYHIGGEIDPRYVVIVEVSLQA